MWKGLRVTRKDGIILCCSCLRAIRMLQKNGHIPSDPSLFKAYAEYGHFVDVRVAALEAVVDYTRGLPFYFQLAIQSEHEVHDAFVYYAFTSI